ncbi:hypothetical protein KA047_00020 [Candidatus Saccharibacteria bacterium]|nr:hypothetical protein [Candidatus Saccharibacteria bacterium]
MEDLSPSDNLLSRAMPGSEPVTYSAQAEEQQRMLCEFREFMQRHQRIRVAIDGPDCISGAYQESDEIV